ncbi:TetR/AcrR family transcriptional regulator [Nonomuraea solani]|uniref:TetR/AcrR family transcriptional regulator n=1 Tax=Nonomuraea solani TaxID=1144553 RepID=UPI000CDF1F89|nr:TetR/AcrR family transcriptional regulator [Nonomuraea solani]
MNPDDPRAQRTRARLKAAVLDLAARQELATITVSALAKRAEVNRATVYLHYPDVDSLVTDAMEDAVAAVARAAALCPLDAPRHRAPEPLGELFEHVAANATMYARMLGPHGSARFAARMRERLTVELSGRFTAGLRPSGWDDVPAELHAAYLSGALVGVIAHWVASRPRAGTDEAALAFWRLFRNGCQAADSR